METTPVKIYTGMGISDVFSHLTERRHGSKIPQHLKIDHCLKKTLPAVCPIKC